MTNIPDLESKWRVAARNQEEAKRAFDETVRQLEGTGAQVAQDPAVRAAASNLAKAIEEWRSTLDGLLDAVNEISSREWSDDS